jgi:CRISPR-associated RAMP protein (TIGR02581 family)
MQRQWLNQAILRLRIKPQAPILVKSGVTSPLAVVDDSPIMTVIRDEKGEQQTIPFIPGTSLKGVLRSHFERVARSVSPQAVCGVFGEQCCYAKYRDEIKMAHEPKKGEETSLPTRSALSYQYSCPSCKTFGSLLFGGRMNIADALPDPAHMPDSQGEIRDGVGIDRVTGGAFRGAKFQYQVVVGGEYLTEISITNFELWQLALWGLFLTDSQNGLISVGSGSSRGFGRIEIAPDARDNNAPALQLSFPRSYTGVSDGKTIQGIAALSDSKDYTASHYGFANIQLDRLEVNELPNLLPKVSGLKEIWGYSAEKSTKILNQLGEILFHYLHECPAWDQKGEISNG